MNIIGFNFGNFLFNIVQEQVERVIGETPMETFPIYEEDTYAILRGDDIIRHHIGANYLPQMCSYVDLNKLIVIVNTTWARTIPLHITKTLVQHEMAHFTKGAQMLSGMELEMYCDRTAAEVVGKDEYKEALLYLHHHYPCTVPLSRIEKFLDNSDKKTFGFKLAKILFSS